MAVYDAFISYSHAKDKPIAAALQSAVQKLGKPWYRRRALRVFRDDTSLSATPSLWPSIERALGESRFLILLASPEAAKSPWVAKEVAYWLDHKSTDTLLIALTHGELSWNQDAGDFRWHESIPLPRNLVRRFSTEPKWVDLRGHRESADTRDTKLIEAGADFAGAIHGVPKEDLLSQELRQQRRALSLAWSAACSLLLLTGFAGWQWYEAFAQRRAAETNERTALTERDRALLVESRLLTDLSRQQRREGDAVAAILLALEALPSPDKNDPLHQRPFFKDAQRALYEALESRKEIELKGGLVGRLLGVRLDPEKQCAYSAEANRVHSLCPNSIPVTMERIFGEASDRVVAINRDSTRVVTVGVGTIKLWGLDSATLIDEFPMATGEIADVSINKEGDLLLIQHGTTRSNRAYWTEGEVKIDVLDLKSRQVTRLPESVVTEFRVLAFSESGRAYAIAKDNAVVICLPPSECADKPIDYGRGFGDRYPSSLRFSHETGTIAVIMMFAPDHDTASRMEPGGHFLLERGEDQYDAENYSTLIVRRHQGEQSEVFDPKQTSGRKDDVTSVSFSEDRSQIFAVYRSGLIKMLQLGSDKKDSEQVLRGHIGDIVAVAYDAFRYKFITLGRDGTFRYWSQNAPFSWDLELGIAPLELNPDNNPDFMIRTDHLAEAMSYKKDEFLQAIDNLLKNPDFARISKAREAMPRCLHPDQRAQFGLDREPPRWCLDLDKWPFDSGEWRGKRAENSARR